MIWIQFDRINLTVGSKCLISKMIVLPYEILPRDCMRSIFEKKLFPMIISDETRRGIHYVRTVMLV